MQVLEHVRISKAVERDVLGQAFLQDLVCLNFSYTRFTGLTGAPQNIRDVLSSFRVYSRRRDDEDGGYQMPHSAFTYLFDPRGRFVEHWPATMEADEIYLRLTRLLED